MSYILKSAIQAANTVVQIKTSIVAKQVVLPVSRPGFIYYLPKNFSALSIEVRKEFEEWTARNVELPERHIYKFKNVHLSWHGIIFKNLSIFIPSLMYPALADNFRGKLLFRQWVGERQALPMGFPLALIFDQWSAGNYFHWVIEAVPKLLLLAKEHPDAVLLLPSSLPDYVTATAKIFGFHKFISIQKGVVYSASSLLWPERMGTFWLQDIGLLQKVREKILNFYNLTKAVPHRKIYVSRSRAKIRRLVNEELLYSWLKINDFEIVFFEDMLFQDQVKLTAEAKIIVGVHGANLTNILFMLPKTKLIELINESNKNLAYYKLATYCDIDYYCLPCQNLGASATNDSDFSVDINELTSLLEKVC